jgi:phosphatidylinositol-3-phosphatase
VRVGLVLLFCLCLPVMKAQVATSNHVVIVVEENHSYSQVIGNANMPYLNSLAAQYSLATQYYSNVHPSIGNYFMLTTGQLVTGSAAHAPIVTADNVVRRLLTAGKTWKSYLEGLPSVGYLGPDIFPYTRGHNPISYLTDVANSQVERLNLVPFPQFPNDLTNHQLPNYSFIVPDQQHNGHNCPPGFSKCSDALILRNMDLWLKTNLGPLLINAAFRQDGILIIVFDEGMPSDPAHGGGHIATIVVGPRVKKGFQSTGFYQHQNVLRTTLDALGIHTYPGKSAGAADLNTF